MNFAWFIANRITFKSKRTFSKLIVRIAIIGIMLGLGVMILTLAIIRGFKSEIRSKVRGFSGDMVVIKNDLNSSYENSPITSDPAFEKKILTSPLVTKVMPFATKPGIIKAKTEIEGIVLKGVDRQYDWSAFKRNMVAGDVIDFSDTTQSKKQLLISQTIANRLGLKVGNKAIIYFVQEPMLARQFVIRGIFSFELEEVDKTYVVGDMSVISRINNWSPGQIGGYEVRATSFDQIKAAEDKVDNLLPSNLKSYSLMDNYPALFAWLDLLDGNTIVVLVLMILVALINMISALLIMILERTTMIGILKAMGAANWTLQKVFLYNAFYIIGLGMLFGNLFGLGLGFIQSYTHLFKLDPDSYFMSSVPVQFNIVDVILLNIGTLIICLEVMIAPSMLVTEITPVKAIRFK
ncbi:MAG TPA: FtsX-like permease family protein [Mucilaginibacter sp.]|nr:FtsX-like permease family protein [Mucilaginibacter sp.]